MRARFFEARRFAPRPLYTVIAASFVVLTIALGNWQTRRAQEKLDLQEKTDQARQSAPLRLTGERLSAEALAQRPVVARGEFLAGLTLFIDNRVYRGAPGYHVVTPMRLDGGPAHVLVNRGWVAVGRDRRVLPTVPIPQGIQEIEGVASVPPTQVYELAPETGEGPLRQHLLLERVAADFRLELQPVVVLQTSPAADGLVRDWPKPAARVDVHLAYALQWYVMAVVSTGLWLGLSFRRREAP